MSLRDIKEEELLELIEEYFDDRVIKRGIEYAKQGRVVNKEFLNPNYLYGEVYGNELYSVEVVYLDGDLYTNCTCPYGEFCKHAVALLLHKGEGKRRKEPNLKTFMKNLLRELEDTGFLSFDEDEWLYIVQNTDKDSVWKSLVDFCKEVADAYYEDFRIDDLIVPFVERLESGDRARFFLDIYNAFDEYFPIGSHANLLKTFEEKDKEVLRKAIEKDIRLRENPFVLTFLGETL